MKIIAPSILSADFSNLSQQIRCVEIGGADWIHCDVMDGHFVPNLTFGPIIVKAVNTLTQLPLDVHLMIDNPDEFIDEFVKFGADRITVHQEAVKHLHRSIQRIKENNIKAGISINPATPIQTIKEVIEEVDLLLIMSVNPGFGGQSFIRSTINKIREARRLRNELGLNFLIEVDGGINVDNIKEISEAGADVFVIGTSIFEKENISAATAEFKNLVNTITV
jgi:ribulose-phosphate 3-epimerase